MQTTSATTATTATTRTLLLVGCLALAAACATEPPSGPNNQQEDPTPPSIAISPTTMAFAAEAGGPNPASQEASVSNSGGGALTGVGTDISYGTGQPGGWLVADMSAGSAPATVSVQPETGTLAAGTYTAVVSVTSGAANNSPQSINVTFEVTDPPEIALSATTVNLAAAEGGANPASRQVVITNSGGGTLNGLARSVSYQAGQPTGWLSATLSGTTANATVTLQATTGSLDAGTYNATVSVTSDVASNSPRSIAVTFTVTAGNVPAIGLSSATASFAAQAGGGNPSDEQISITNIGSGTLTGLSQSISYQGGQPTGWLDASLSGTTAPATLTLGATTGGLTAGTYNATVSVMSAVAGNSPRTIAVTFTITPAANPTIGLSSTSANFSAQAGGGNPSSQQVSVTNSGSGTLTGLAQSISYQGGQPTGWLSASLSGTTAPATLTLSATTGALAAGTYNATVSITSGVAGNSPRTIAVTFTVSAAPAIGLSATSATFNAQVGGGNPSSQQISITNTGGGALTGIGRSVSYQGGQPSGWLSTTLSGTSAPATLTLQPATGTLQAGTYNATVSVTSPVATNSPRTISVTFTVAPQPAPQLSGPSNDADGTYQLTWTYDWTPCTICSSQNGYELYESATSASSGYNLIFNTVGTGDRQTPKTVTVPNRPAGTYWYRVRANDGGLTAFSNVIQVTVTGPSEITALATADNLLLYSTTDAALANQVFSSGNIAVGFNFIIGTFSDYVQGLSAIKFDGVQSQIAGQTIASATLRLWVNILPADLNSTYTVTPVATGWSTSTISYNNAPNIYTAAQLQADFAPPVTAVVPVEVDITAIVQAWANGSIQNHGLILRDRYTASFPPSTALRATEFESEDTAPTATRTPQIEIVFGSSPPPVTAQVTAGSADVGRVHTTLNR